MAFTEKIRVLFEIDDRAAVGSFGNITKSIKEADGVNGKFKAGLSSTSSFLKANAAEAAMAAGTALVAFGVQSVKAFQDTALEAGRMSEALGISVQNASRLREVAGDLGVEVGTVQGAMQRMNKAIADGKVNQLELGDSIVRTSSGAVDSYESFINLADAIGQIEDPTLRAQKAQQLFGRSYGEMAEMLQMGAGELRAALDSVSEAKVVDEEELKRARQFRDSMDELRGKIEDLSIAVGESLVPVLTDLADGFTAVDEAAAKLPFVDGAGDVVQYGQKFFEVASGIDVARKAFNLFGDEAEEATDKVGNLTGTSQTGADVLAMYEAMAERAGTSTRYLGQEARSTANDIERMYEARGAEAAAERLSLLRQRLNDVAKQIGGIPAEKMVEINTLLNEGNLRAAEAAINTLARSRVAEIVVSVGAAMGGAMGKLGTGITASVAAGAKMGASLFAKAIVSAGQAAAGGGGGGGGGAEEKSPAELEVERWDAAMEKAVEYGDITRQEYIDYLNMRMAGEDQYSEAYYRYWKIRQGLESEIAREDEKRRQDQERAEKEAADEAKRRADELKRAADEAARASEQLTINVYSNSLDPMAVARAIEQAKRMGGRRFLE